MTVACELCAKLFASEDDYKTHLDSKLHLRKMQGVCSVCDFYVGPPSHMAKHLLTKNHQKILKIRQEGGMLASDLYPTQNTQTTETVQPEALPIITTPTPLVEQVVQPEAPKEVDTLVLTGISSKKKFTTDVKLMEPEQDSHECYMKLQRELKIGNADVNGDFKRLHNEIPKAMNGYEQIATHFCNDNSFKLCDNPDRLLKYFKTARIVKERADKLHKRGKLLGKTHSMLSQHLNWLISNLDHRILELTHGMNG